MRPWRWVRRTYCDGAVETEEQRAFVEAFTAEIDAAD